LSLIEKMQANDELANSYCFQNCFKLFPSVINPFMKPSLRSFGFKGIYEQGNELERDLLPYGSVSWPGYLHWQPSKPFLNKGSSTATSLNKAAFSYLGISVQIHKDKNKIKPNHSYFYKNLFFTENYARIRLKGQLFLLTRACTSAVPPNRKEILPDSNPLFQPFIKK